jgi:hypothetical protein
MFDMKKAKIKRKKFFGMFVFGIVALVTLNLYAAKVCVSDDLAGIIFNYRWRCTDSSSIAPTGFENGGAGDYCWCLIRSSWVYTPRGNKGKVLTELRECGETTRCPNVCGV